MVSTVESANQAERPVVDIEEVKRRAANAAFGSYGAVNSGLFHHSLKFPRSSLRESRPVLLFELRRPLLICYRHCEPDL